MASAPFPRTTRAISASDASLALRCRLIQTTRGPGAGAEPSSSAAFILSRSEPRYELLYWFPDCCRRGADGHWRRELHRSRGRLGGRADNRRSGRDGIRVGGRPAPGCDPILSFWGKNSLAVPVAPS